MIVTFKRFALAVGVLTLVGCASSPAQHYTLSRTDRPSLQATSMALPPAAASVGAYTLSEISVPAQVDNISLVVRQGDGRLMVLNEDRWSGSLASQLLTAVSQSLTQKLGMPPIQKLVAEAASSSVTRIQLDVQRFDLIPGQSVSLDAVWSVRFPGSRTFLTCYTRLEQNVGIGVLALVQGQQNNVEALAAQLAQALMSRQAPAGSQCTR